MICRQTEVRRSTQVKLTVKLIKLGKLLMETRLDLIATAEELIAFALGELLMETLLELTASALELIAIAEVATEIGGCGKGWVRGLESMYILVMRLNYLIYRQFEVMAGTEDAQSPPSSPNIQPQEAMMFADEASEAGGCGGGQVQGPTHPGVPVFTRA